MTARASQTAMWNPARNIGELNSSAIDQPVWISDDECTVYLTSNSPGGVGGYDILVATRTP
jgi:hypothetical protein